MKHAIILFFTINIALLSGCSVTNPAAEFMAHMDSAAPGEQLPNWASTKALMMREPPKVGDIAPNFALKTKAGDTATSLAQFKDKKPVVLIFGSWT